MAVAALTSCVGTTTIVSNPPGAEVYVRDTLAGITPFVYQDIRISFTKQSIVVKKDGHQTQNIAMRRNGKFEAKNLLGAPLIYPLFYLANYPDSTIIDLNKAQLQTADALDENALLMRDPQHLQQALADLETQLEQGAITKKAYKSQRKFLKKQLRNSSKAD